ncbi:MAG: acyltransferase [Candidatus Aenigmarchaeota archaeon]|nr:acyltransferase [Candidatus Aenigmarchaeota archaeon]
MFEPIFEQLPTYLRVKCERAFHRYRIAKTAVICSGVKIRYRNKKTKGQLIMRKNSWVLFNCFLDITKTIHIGEDVQIAPGAMIFTHDSSLSMENPVEKEVVIENGAYIGAGAIILPGIRIGKNAVVGAGAVVTKDVKEKTTVVGVPADIISR